MNLVRRLSSFYTETTESLFIETVRMSKTTVHFFSFQQ